MTEFPRADASRNVAWGTTGRSSGPPAPAGGVSALGIPVEAEVARTARTGGADGREFIPPVGTLTTSASTLPSYCPHCEGVCGSFNPDAACSCDECSRCDVFAELDIAVARRCWGL